jgi:hypothetical protein
VQSLTFDLCRSIAGSLNLRMVVWEYLGGRVETVVIADCDKFVPARFTITYPLLQNIFLYVRTSLEAGKTGGRD